MKILVLANQKGGVGKSAVGCQLAYYLALLGQRILFLDMDHQKNSSKALKLSARAMVASFTTSQLLNGQSGVLPDADFVLVQGEDLAERSGTATRKAQQFCKCAEIVFSVGRESV